MTVSSYIELKTQCETQMDLASCNGCTACALRCADGIQTSLSEWQTLRHHLESRSEADRRDIAEVEAQNKEWSLGDDVTVTMCRYWDRETGRCAIYPVRPLVCRLLGQVEWMPCPIQKVRHIVSTPDALALMHAYADFDRRTFAEWETAGQQGGS